jgi:hypothetical protein
MNIPFKMLEGIATVEVILPLDQVSSANVVEILANEDGSPMGRCWAKIKIRSISPVGQGYYITRSDNGVSYWEHKNKVRCFSPGT